MNCCTIFLTIFHPAYTNNYVNNLLAVIHNSLSMNKYTLILYSIWCKKKWKYYLISDIWKKKKKKMSISIDTCTCYGQCDKSVIMNNAWALWIMIKTTGLGLINIIDLLHLTGQYEYCYYLSGQSDKNNICTRMHTHINVIDFLPDWLTCASQ